MVPSLKKATFEGLMMTTPKHEVWSSRPAFLLATAGAAVGLGNLWRFPFIAGENGGAAFVLVYLGFILLLGIPIMIAEMLIGRIGGASAVTSMHVITSRYSLPRGWNSIGWISVFAPLIGLSFYSVVGGWSLSYLLDASSASFDQLSTEQSQTAFDTLLASPMQLLLAHSVFLVAVIVVIARGLHGGIEWVAKLMMPALFLLLLVLVVHALRAGDIQAAAAFLMQPDWSRLTPTAVLMALGQALFSLAVGVGVLLTYSAYLPSNDSLARSAVLVALIDSAVALLAGIAIFPMVFEYGLDPAGGPGLIFVTMPVVFGQMPGGAEVGFIFFLLLFFAAFSTAIGMLEPVVSWLQEHQKLSRPAMAFAAGFFAWSLGVVAALSFNLLSELRMPGVMPLLSDKNVFGVLDLLVSTILLPLNAFLIAVFVGWVLSREALREQLQPIAPVLFSSWFNVLRYLAPVAIVMVFISNLAISAHGEETAGQNDITFVVAGKTSNYRQSAGGEVNALNYHFFAEIFLQPEGQVTDSSLLTPLSAGEHVVFEDGGYALELHGGRYTNEAELEAAYPDGEYIFHYTSPGTGTVSQTVVLGNPRPVGSGLPVAPRIMLQQAGESVAPGEIDPELDLQVSWSEFAEGGADPLGIMDDLLFVIMADCHGERRAHSGRPFENRPFLTYADDSFVIEAEILKAENIYQLSVEHAVLDTTIEHGVPAFATFATTTFLDLQTSGAAADGEACLRIHKRFDAGQTDR